MIKSIRFENFFSFGVSSTIELNNSSNILLGINGSGKSNFIKAIRFLYESISGNGLEKIFLKDWSGFSAVSNFSGSHVETIKISYEFNHAVLNRLIGNLYRFNDNPVYEIIIHKSGTSSYYLEESLWSPASNCEKEPFIFLKMKNGKGIVSTHQDGNVELKPYPDAGSVHLFKEQELILRQISEPNRFIPLFALKSAIETISVYDYFDTTLNSPIRTPQTFGSEARLLPSGSNIVKILHHIKSNHTLFFEKIEKLLTDVNPHFRDINFDVQGSKFSIALREKNLAKTVGVEHISDGTLRFMLLLAILHNPDRGCVICLDEPEIGLHPDMINMVAESIKLASKTSQIIIVTHSPLLLNAFDLDDCLIFEKNTDNETLVTRKTEDDFPDWDNDFLVGQLWLSGKIGATRW